MKFRNIRPTVIKDLEPQGVSVLYPATPHRVSMFTDPQKQTIKREFSHLADLIPQSVQNRRYRRAMRKPLRPNNLRRQMKYAAFKAAALQADSPEATEARRLERIENAKRS